MVSIGSTFLAIGDVERAAECLLGAIDVDSSNADAYYYLGIISITNKQFENAVELFGQVLDIQPKHVGALRDSALSYLSMGEFVKASERIKKALDLDGEDRQLRLLSRRIYFGLAAKQIFDFFRRLRH